ncbi:natterin-4 [Sergentomyia squamirostris]
MPDSPPYIGFRPEFMPPETPTSPYQPPLAALSYAMPMPSFPPAPQPLISSSSSSEAAGGEEVFGVRNLISFDVAGYCWQWIGAGAPVNTEILVRAGRDADGSIIYVGRAFHEGDMIPAKVIPDKNIAYVAYGGEEHPKEEFEVLRTGDFAWEFATNGDIPPGAVEIGQTADGEKLFMGRCLYNGTQTPGKIQSSHGCLYIPFDGEEVSVTEYEVLVIK